MVQFRFRVVRLTGCAFSGAPRQTIINRLFCRQGRCCLEIVRQNILLSQNGSTLNSCRNSEETKIGCPKGHPIFVVRSTGIEDIRRYEKSLDFQGFFTLNAKVDAKIFLGRYDVAGLI